MSHNKPTKHITSSTSPSTVTRRVVSEEELVLKSRELVRSKLQLLLSLDATGTPTTLWKDTYRSVLVRVQKSSQKRKPNKVDTYVANTLNQLCKLLDDDTLTQEQFEKETGLTIVVQEIVEMPDQILPLFPKEKLLLHTEVFKTIADVLPQSASYKKAYILFATHYNSMNQGGEFRLPIMTHGTESVFRIYKIPMKATDLKNLLGGVELSYSKNTALANSSSEIANIERKSAVPLKPEIDPKIVSIVSNLRISLGRDINNISLPASRTLLLGVLPILQDIEFQQDGKVLFQKSYSDRLGKLANQQGDVMHEFLSNFNKSIS